MDTPESLTKKRQAAYNAVEKKELDVESAVRLADAERRADAALKVAERANHLNRVLIVITAAIGFLTLVLEFFANYESIAVTVAKLL